jgi:uncharacterized protein YqjF (DUF2071 family)
MPDAPWLMAQTWHDLLFAHWPVPPQQLRPAVPPAFNLDLFDGTAWIGIVPFRTTNVALRGMPSLPWVSAFPELNVRTYVTVGDRPGIYFFSLDAGSRIVVHSARALLKLPYFAASMTVAHRAGAVQYESCRDDDYGAAHFSAKYEGVGPPSHASPGTLEYFLTERYCLYNLDHLAAPCRYAFIHNLPSFASAPRRRRSSIDRGATEPDHLRHACRSRTRAPRSAFGMRAR